MDAVHGEDKSQGNTVVGVLQLPLFNVGGRRVAVQSTLSLPMIDLMIERDSLLRLPARTPRQEKRLRQIQAHPSRIWADKRDPAFDVFLKEMLKYERLGMDQPVTATDLAFIKECSSKAFRVAMLPRQSEGPIDMVMG